MKKLKEILAKVRLHNTSQIDMDELERLIRLWKNDSKAKWICSHCGKAMYQNSEEEPRF